MGPYKNKAVVLGISANGLGIVRSLGRRGVPVVVSDSDTSTNLYSRYISERWFFYGNDKELIEELLVRGASFSEKPVLFPVRDSTVLALAERIDEIRKYYLIVMPPFETVRRALCKTTFAQMAEKLGLTVPRSFSISQGITISDVPDDLKFPVIVKPEYRNDNYGANVSGKAFKAENIQELSAFYEKFSAYQQEAIVQEYIPGGDSDLYFCFQYYAAGAGQSPVYSLSGRKIRQFPSLCGSTSSCEVSRDPQIETLATSFFTRIGYVGPCSMEFKRDPRDGVYYFIEPTIGRHDWNNAFGEGNGIPMPYINYLDALGKAIPRYRQKKIPRRWIRWSADFETAKEKMKQDDLSLLSWLKSIRPPVTGAIFALDDIKPFFRMYMKRVENKLSKIISRLNKYFRKKLRKFYLREEYIVFKKKIDKNKLPSLSERFLFREAKLEDVHLLVKKFRKHYSEEDRNNIFDKIKRGDHLLLGTLRHSPDDICMQIWLSEKDPFFLEEKKINNLSKALCSNKSIVREEFRNIGFGREGKLYLEHFAAEMNIDELVSYVRIDNCPQIKISHLVGNVEKGRLYRKILCGKESFKFSF
ncbi:hypothetical protein [uncultured Desulfuromonas sp.]|uniref:carboxylate--amine ligase n=1 Tax=uncultured Desulfuromonas sp. TaxID=181013 RepID=UPI002AAB3A7E|nr:hypothetical protein [uncultured Desulfuromonas sp.]